MSPITDTPLSRAADAALDSGVEAMLQAWMKDPYVFNRGHGISPNTPIEHLKRVVRITGTRA